MSRMTEKWFLYWQLKHVDIWIKMRLAGGMYSLLFAKARLPSANFLSLQEQIWRQQGRRSYFSCRGCQWWSIMFLWCACWLFCTSSWEWKTYPWLDCPTLEPIICFTYLCPPVPQMGMWTCVYHFVLLLYWWYFFCVWLYDLSSLVLNYFELHSH